MDFIFCSELRCMWHRLLCHSLVPSERYSANLTSRSPLLEERSGRALFDNLSFVVTYQFYFLYSTTFSTCSTMLCYWCGRI